MQTIRRNKRPFNFLPEGCNTRSLHKPPYNNRQDTWQQLQAVSSLYLSRYHRQVKFGLPDAFSPCHWYPTWDEVIVAGLGLCPLVRAGSNLASTASAPSSNLTRRLSSVTSGAASSSCAPPRDTVRLLRLSTWALTDYSPPIAP